MTNGIRSISSTFLNSSCPALSPCISDTRYSRLFSRFCGLEPSHFVHNGFPSTDKLVLLPQIRQFAMLRALFKQDRSTQAWRCSPHRVWSILLGSRIIEFLPQTAEGRACGQLRSFRRFRSSGLGAASGGGDSATAESGN
jgi:hypothetical protein